MVHHLHLLCLGDDVIEHDKDHGTGSECQGVRQDGTDQLDRQTPEDPGEWLDQSGQLPVPDAASERHSGGLEGQTDCQAFREVLDADSEGEIPVGKEKSVMLSKGTDDVTMFPTWPWIR